MKKNVLIVPCYNEEEILQYTFEKLSSLYKDLIARKVIDPASRICLVNDGSRDKTWEIIDQLCTEHEIIQGIKLSRNFGHQAALIAGLESKCGKFDTYISIDADLQDDICVIVDMIRESENGASIVLGVRNDRSTDSFFKRSTAKGFYKIMSFLGADSVYNHADYRLIDNKALKELLRFQERNLFLRGIIPMVGFKTAMVYYKRSKREYGESKYPLRKMIGFAWEGVTSVSSKPLSMILYIGLIMFAFSIAILIWAFVVMLKNLEIPGWFSLIFPTTFFGGVQMISIGVIGEYIGKIYREIKARPRYIIDIDKE
jgi:glycosyltransferase involved in cell wall biosynthesis